MSFMVSIAVNKQDNGKYRWLSIGAFGGMSWRLDKDNPKKLKKLNKKVLDVLNKIPKKLTDVGLAGETTEERLLTAPVDEIIVVENEDTWSDFENRTPQDNLERFPLIYFLDPTSNKVEEERKRMADEQQRLLMKIVENEPLEKWIMQYPLIKQKSVIKGYFDGQTYHGFNQTLKNENQKRAYTFTIKQEERTEKRLHLLDRDFYNADEKIEEIVSSIEATKTLYNELKKIPGITIYFNFNYEYPNFFVVVN